MQDAFLYNTKYVVVEDWKNNHTELQDPPQCKFKFLGSYLSTIQRQLHEGLAIEANAPETLINGGGENGINGIPRYKMAIED